MQEKKLLARIAMLPTMSATELKKMWRDIYDSEPTIFSRAHLEQRLTYRLQEIAYGGLTEKTIEKMKRLRDVKADTQRKQTVKPPTGTVLLKEYQGIEHRVRVLPDGFDYNGQKFKSLTALAFKITGTRWNGPLFFGLRK